MSTRLQVVLDEQELAEIRATAQQQQMTVSEWVRQVLRAARRAAGAGDIGQKLAAVREAARHTYPTADIDSMVQEIERGYGEGMLP